MSWTCPFCSHIQIVGQDNSHRGFSSLLIGDNKLGNIGLHYEAVACLNPACREVSLSVSITERIASGPGTSKRGSTIQSYQLRPESNALVFPDCVPSPLRQDYIEACRIKNLSPKASATLSRRCLQGIIRDFCGISKATLGAEIKSLEDALSNGQAPYGVTHESIDAIDHVRKIGNIGAHMEKDINSIIEIDEGEAQALIELIELLFEEWYVEREKRAARLAKVREIREAKDKQKQTKPSVS
jgi:hypothetical protein